MREKERGKGKGEKQLSIYIFSFILLTQYTQKSIRNGARLADEATTSVELTRMVHQLNQRFAPTPSSSSTSSSTSSPSPSPVEGLVVDYEEVSSLSLHQRVALWLVADVFLLTSIREGLNLNPLEYIYSRKGEREAGVVVASEFTACSSLLSGALKVSVLVSLYLIFDI